MEDMVSEQDFRQMLTQTMHAQTMLKQGYTVRDISLMLSIPHTMVSDLKKEMGIGPRVASKQERTRKQKRKAQKVARRKNRG